VSRPALPSLKVPSSAGNLNPFCFTPSKLCGWALTSLLVFGALFAGSAQALTATEVQKLLADDVATGARFGSSVSVEGDTVLIGAPQDDDNGIRSGSAYVFTRDASGNWVQQAKLLAADGASGHQFGGAVSLDGDMALIGAHLDDDNGSGSGSAYVFTRNASGAWSQQAKLLAADGASGHQFGGAVSLDGDMALIGARLDDDNGRDSGSAYVFTRDASGAWSQQAKLLAADGTEEDRFGFSVSHDGDTALIGAVWDDDIGNFTGSAYVFQLGDETGIDPQARFAEERVLNDPTPTERDLFGHSVALNSRYLLVGAPNDSTQDAGVGQAHLFDANTGVLLQTFDEPTPTSDGTFGDQFGFSVALGAERVLIGAAGDSTQGPFVGQAHLFDIGAGALLHTFEDPTPTFFDRFGSSVAMDGDRVLVGDAQDDTEGVAVGQAHLFDANTGTLLQTFNNPMPVRVDLFGYSVALKSNKILIGAPGMATQGEGFGQAHLFDANTGSLLRTFEDPTPTSSDLFGASVALSGDLVLIGAPLDDTQGEDVGQVHLFDANTGALLHTLNNPTPTSADRFGGSVALKGDRVLVGAPLNDSQARDAGQAHLFDASTGDLVQTLGNPRLDFHSAGDLFGFSVALEEDRLLIGARFAQDPSGEGAGRAAYVFIDESALPPQMNEPPTVDAGPDAPIRAGSIIQLEATASDDNTPVSELSVQWQVISQPQDSQVEFFTPNALATGVRVDTDGAYEIGISVTDTEGLGATDSLTLSDTNLAPVADGGEDQMVYAGATVTLDASAGHDPEGDPIVDYEWVLGLKPEGSAAALSDPTIVNPQFVADLPGTYRIYNLIADFLGFGDPDAVEVTALSPEDFAQVEILEASETIAQLDATQVTNSGNQRAMGELFKQAVRMIQNEQPEQAVKKLNDARNRTDGCLDGGGQPDERGPGRDWVTDCDAQAATVLSIDRAINALSP